ncbi:TIGR03790 family protein [Oleidesulfovibrio sp.]|uniref:TIGR03790 family protein n=1 Tax=Oleidesulfovibrio sp. TaxID=2909707 RepID=UPI003A85D786
MMLNKQVACLLAAAIFCTAIVTCGFAPSVSYAAPQPEPVFTAGEVHSGDGMAELLWQWNDEVVKLEGVKGLKVYRLRTGDEMAFRVDPIVLVKDCGMDTSLRIEDLQNGRQYVYFLHTYNAEGKELPRAMLLARPGLDPQGVPQAVKNLYAVSGNGAVGIFWDIPEERDVVGYEFSRKARGDADYTLLARFPLFVKGKMGQGDKAAPLPIQRPGFFRDVTLADGHDYWYRIRVADSEGNLSVAAEVGPVRTSAARPPLAEDVLLIARKGDDASLRVARHYAAKRNIPEKRILQVSIPKGSHLYRNHQVLNPVREHLLNSTENGIPLAAQVRVIVPCYGIPLRDGKRGIDSMLTDLFDRYTWGRQMGTPNPMFQKDGNFDPSHGLYLVTRLDGESEEAAKALVDKAVQAEKTVKVAETFAVVTKEKLVTGIEEAASRHNVALDFKPLAYTRDNDLPENTMWFYGSGHPYRALRKTQWPVGAVAAFLKSDTLARLSADADYWVPGLLREGVTATFGAVAEPYVEGYTRGDVFFDRFWSGKYSFAEAMFMATPTVRWMMCGVGDPLYRLSGNEQ